MPSYPLIRKARHIIHMKLLKNYLILQEPKNRHGKRKAQACPWGHPSRQSPPSAVPESCQNAQEREQEVQSDKLNVGWRQAAGNLG